MVSSIIIVGTPLNCLKYLYVTLMILFSTNNLFANSDVLSSIANTYSFINTQLNGFKHSYLTLIILFNTIPSFAHRWF